jgi:vancomycin resistance protein YoaR
MVVTTPRSPQFVRHQRLLALLVGVLGGLSLLLLGISAFVLPSHDRIAYGVSVLGTPLGGLTASQASPRIATALTRVTTRSVQLQAGPHTRQTQWQALGVMPETWWLQRAALAVGRRGTWPQCGLTAARARWSGVELAPRYRLDRPRARAAFAAWAEVIDQAPLDATANWDEQAGQVQITPGRSGARLDTRAALKTLIDDTHALVARTPPAALVIPYREVAPRLTAEQLTALDTVLGIFTTSFSTSTTNRATNVSLAAEAIDGTILLPGETFSFNRIVGPRNQAAGFRTAPVIVNGQLQAGVGGGICQVSSTLYNAALLANLAIVSRSHHSLPVAYVPAGLDATVAYGAIDFRVRNPMATPVLIESQVQGRRLVIRIVGKGPAPVVRIARDTPIPLPLRTVVKSDATLPKGTQVVEKAGKAGKIVAVYREAGEEPQVTRKLISRDRYYGEPRIIRRGTADPTAVIPSTVPGGATTVRHPEQEGRNVSQ